jgi:hypothetical protein
MIPTPGCAPIAGAARLHHRDKKGCGPSLAISPPPALAPQGRDQRVDVPSTATRLHPREAEPSWERPCCDLQTLEQSSATRLSGEQVAAGKSSLPPRAHKAVRRNLPSDAIVPTAACACVRACLSVRACAVPVPVLLRAAARFSAPLFCPRANPVFPPRRLAHRPAAASLLCRGKLD